MSTKPAAPTPRRQRGSEGVEGEARQAVSSAPSFRRIWKRHDGSQGSSRLTLKAMAVLYDAGTPLSSEEIVERLIPQLDAYERSYLEAWHLRRRQLVHRSVNKHRKAAVISVSDSTDITAGDFSDVVRTWVSCTFLKRAYASEGQSLIKDPDGRYRPGPRAARVLTLDGRLIAFTPEARRELEQAEHDAGRAHLALVEWERLTRTLDLTTQEARAQLLMVIVRRLVMGRTLETRKRPLDERTIGPQLHDLIRLADTPGVQRIVLQRALDALWASEVG